MVLTKAKFMSRDNIVCSYIWCYAKQKAFFEQFRQT